MEIKESIMFFRLSFSMPRQTRKVQAQADIDPRRLRASAKLYSGEAFAAIKSFDADLRGRLTRLAIQIPACFRGVYVLPVAVLDRVQAALDAGMTERNKLVESFLTTEYASEREATRAALNSAFREEDFPPVEVIRNRFRLQWSIFQMSVPDNLPADVLQAERNKLAKQIDDVATQCRAALREAFADLVGHLADKLAPESDGTRKRLCASTIANLREFLDTVNARDITSDDQIRTLSEKCRGIIGQYSADDLRKGGITASRIRTGLSTVKAEIDNLIERGGGRKIDLDME